MEYTTPSPDRLFAIDPDLGDLLSSRWLPGRRFVYGKECGIFGGQYRTGEGVPEVRE